MTGLLLLAYGSPERAEDIRPYLEDVRAGKPVSDELVDSLRRRYAAIGGTSPLTRITLAQAAGMQSILGDRCHVAVGMKHWKPSIADGVAHLNEAGATNIRALVLAPHTVFGYRERLDAEVALIDPWCAHPSYVAYMASLIRSAAHTGPIVFTAHSLPPQAAGDYASRLSESAACIADAAQVSDWSLAYQSASGPGWLGPDIAEAVTSDALIVPFGFVSDHLEVMYDLDVVHPGIRRLPMPNDNPAFLQCLADIVETA